MSPKTAAAAVAFVEFTDLASSALALQTFNDFRISPTDKHGLRLEYARASMGAPAKRPLQQTIALSQEEAMAYALPPPLPLPPQFDPSILYAAPLSVRLCVVLCCVVL